jgi:hypothetical protein
VATMVEQAQNVQIPNYSGVNIQIFNPSVAAPGAAIPPSTINTTNYATTPISYPQNYYTQNFVPPTIPAPAKQITEPEKKKTEKREIVQLTDDYIKSLEKSLNNQNKQIRVAGAKEVFERLKEDDSRKDDAALNALVNKMLQDPYEPVKFIAMAALESRITVGNDTTKKILSNIQQQKTGYGEDAIKASNILLKMSGQTVQKEFEVKDQPEKEKKKE